ncbi:MAG TPA: hypothetical protein DDZ89_06610 [Clostridiales bacterium]|mgnify:CR=1 FL=1|nr:hypothetical protein [Clostridiales bacterium]
MICFIIKDSTMRDITQTNNRTDLDSQITWKRCNLLKGPIVIADVSDNTVQVLQETVLMFLEK